MSRVNSKMEVIQELPRTINFSYGVSHLNINTSFEDALKQADKKMYIHKQSVK